MEGLRIGACIGPTRSSKTYTINKLTGGNAPVGAEDGESTTLTVEIYKANTLNNTYLIDVPGFRDSNLRISDTEIQDRIKTKLLSLMTPKIDFLLIFESVMNDAIGLRHTLSQAEKLFGNEYKKSAIVLYSKLDDDINFVSRENSLKRICEAEKIDYLRWTNFCSEDKFISNTIALEDKINTKEPLSLNGMHDYINRINELSLTLQNESIYDKVVTENIEYDEDEVYEVPVTVQIEKIVPKFTDPNEIEKEAVNYRNNNKRTEKESVPVAKTRSTLKKVNLSPQEIEERAKELRKKDGEYNTVEETYYEEEEFEEAYWTVEYRRTGDREYFGLVGPREKEPHNVQKYRTSTRMVPKIRTINILKDLGPFILTASKMKKDIYENESYVDYVVRDNEVFPDIKVCRDYIKSLTKKVLVDEQQMEKRVRKVKKTKEQPVTVKVVPQIELFIPRAISLIEEEIINKYRK